MIGARVVILVLLASTACRLHAARPSAPGAAAPAPAPAAAAPGPAPAAPVPSAPRAPAGAPEGPSVALKPTVPRARLPWVSPSRCLRPCGHDPADALVTVDDRGALSAAGRHRLAADAQAPLAALIAAADDAKRRVRLSSAYRSYERQAVVFGETPQVGRAARPGHSEHQIGAALDLRLSTSAASAWLAAHAHQFGFVLSYPPRKQKRTGYPSEAWHIRYVGKEIAALAHERGESLEELFRAGLVEGVSGDCSDCAAVASRPEPCGAVTEGGTCEGPVLSFCFDGVLARIDCAAARQVCRQERPGAEADCAPGPPDLQAPPPAAGTAGEGRLRSGGPL